MRLSITVADDNQKALEVLTQVLSSEFEVLATTMDGSSALEQIRRLQPCVAILDLDMPGLNGIEIAREIARQGLPSRVIICTVERDPDLIEAALNAGALGYVFKANLKTDLPVAVRCAASGESFISHS